MEIEIVMGCIEHYQSHHRHSIASTTHDLEHALLVVALRDAAVHEIREQPGYSLSIH